MGDMSDRISLARAIAADLLAIKQGRWAEQERERAAAIAPTEAEREFLRLGGRTSR